MSETDFADLRDQFNSFDLNKDGMIDLEELCVVLDRLGDGSTPEERQQHFDTVDTDDSGAVDFEEFLELVQRVTNGELDKSKGFGKAYSRTAKSTLVLNKIPIETQIRYRLI